MASPRMILCGGVREGQLPVRDDDPLRLRRYGDGANVTLRADAIRQELTRNVPDPLRDLLDIAAYVYTADQAVSRGSPAAIDQGASWRRHLHFRVPVRVPDLWQDAETARLLADTLSFLSDDSYEFDFRPWRGGETGSQQLLDFGASPLSGVVDEVVMFSGGLDSLGGAVEEVVNQGRQVLLVNHRSNPKPVAAQLRLVEAVTRRAGTNAPQLMAVWGNKRKALNAEYTQRARSFLFASLGATAAHMVGLSRLRFYENGVVSLNLPLAGQIVGGRATRTTHPKVLAGFGALFSRLVGSPFVVENPFLWKTKTEVVRLIGAGGLAGSIGCAGSCTHTWARPEGKTHCGDCSQCIDRRFAVLAAGLAAHDPADGYHIDLWAGERTKEESRLLVAGYLETVRTIDRMSDPRDFFARFGGEVGRILPHPSGGAEVNARLVFDLLRRHAGQVWGAVNQGLIDHVDLVTQRRLPATCLLRQVIDTGTVAAASPSVAVAGGPVPAAEPAPPPAATHAGPSITDSHLFRPNGRCWLVGLAKSVPVMVLPARGLVYIHTLLSNPGVPVSAFDLACRVHRGVDRVDIPAGGELSDSQAVDAYRARHEELQDAMREARARGDADAAERCRREMADLLVEINRVSGLGGRLRPATNAAERARKAVGMAVTRAVAEIAKYAPATALHLRTHITGGMRLTYRPPDETPWQLGPP